MSYHKREFPRQAELTQALKDHGLEHRKPSQLADAFRLGWQAATRAQPQADAVEPVAWEVWGPADRAWVRASKATYDACGLRSNFRRRALIPVEAQAPGARGEGA